MNWKNYTLQPEANTRRQQRAQHATQAQMAAMRPASSVQVAASAGTGKTHVLTLRFLRLLLEDFSLSPSDILAVTYTKAGATEMQNRLTTVLGRWAVATEDALRKELTYILEADPSEKVIHHARSLFTSVLDDPVGIRVMTVHSFCQSLLQQFPLEAGISAGFRILEGREADALLQEQLAEAFTHMADWTPEDSLNWWAFSTMVSHLADATLQSEFKSYIDSRRRYERLFENGGGLDGVLQTLAEALEITPPEPQKPPNDVLTDLQTQHIQHIEKYRSLLKEFSEGLAQEGQRALERKEQLDIFLSAQGTAQQLQALPALIAVFETDKNERRAKFVPAKLAKEKPILVDDIEAFYDVLASQKETRNKYRTYFKTASYLVMAHTISRRYADVKNSRGFLDFEDLIHHCKNLLAGDAGKAAWVRFKMDGRLHHIMLDEAQDTDSDQWEIIRALIDDFFAGQGQHDGNHEDGANEQRPHRTFFAVGDGKQAIYRFRGAERHVFEAMHPAVQQLAAPSGHQVHFVDLNTSFRSSDVILDFVDQVFAAPENHQAIEAIGSGENTNPLKHEAFHLGAGGRVEIWPLKEPPEKEKNSKALEGWQLPLPERNVQDEETVRMALFGDLAKRLRQLIEEPPFLATEGRFLVGGDIMVLCRSSAHMDMFLTALAQQGVTASKTGDVALVDAPAVTDLMAVLRFLANPSDDLALLHTLRSPLFGLTDKGLDDLRRQHKQFDDSTYFKTLCRLDDQQMATTLKTLLNQVDLATPHQLLRAVLSLTEGRGLLLWRYTGATESAAAHAINQTLDRFLDAALAYGGKEGNSLTGFLHWFDQGGLRTKIEGGVNVDTVRVMTAHASKGLQAPVVVLPETSGDFYQNVKKEHKLWRTDPATKQDDLFLLGSNQMACTALQKDLLDAEEKRVLGDEMRLLYVAMTRAQERLIVAGTATSKNNDSWYTRIKNQISEQLPNWKEMDDGTLVFEQAHLFTDAPITPEAKEEKTAQPDTLPAWLHTAPPKEQRDMAKIASSLEGDDNRAAQLLEGETRQKFRRGVLLHRLLEVLPALPDEATRREKGARFLAHSGQDFSAVQQQAMLEDALNVCRHHGELFAEGYHPEATLARGIVQEKSHENLDKEAKTGRLKGRIDCLRVTLEAVYIVDYKTDVNPPDVPPRSYQKQLELYATMAAGIWPNRKIQTGILWTSATPPRLDWLSG